MSKRTGTQAKNLRRASRIEGDIDGTTFNVRVLMPERAGDEKYTDVKMNVAELDNQFPGWRSKLNRRGVK